MNPTRLSIVMFAVLALVLSASAAVIEIPATRIEVDAPEKVVKVATSFVDRVGVDKLARKVMESTSWISTWTSAEKKAFFKSLDLSKLRAEFIKALAEKYADEPRTLELLAELYGTEAGLHASDKFTAMFPELAAALFGVPESRLKL